MGRLRADRFPGIARWLGGKPSTTADLYLGLSCADVIADGRIERIAPTVFRAGSTLIVFRHDAGVAPLPVHKRVIWVIDDDVRAGVLDNSLPMWYRLRLGCLEGRAASRLMRAADQIVVPGPGLRQALAKRFPTGVEVVEMAPVWPPSLAPLPDPSRAPQRIAWLGAASHARDAMFACDILRGVLRRYPEMTVVWSMNHPLPDDLARHPRIERVAAMNWASYRHWLLGARFDIGLYPICATPFNRGRSANKLGEYDQAGAAVLGARIWTDAHLAEAAGACWLLPENAEVWADAIGQLRHDPEKCHALAAANRQWQSVHGPKSQRTQWQSLLPDIDFSTFAKLMEVSNDAN